MANKITKRDVLKRIIEVCAEDEVIVAYATKEIASMDAKNEKRKNAEKKPTKAQLEAIERKPLVLAELGDEGKTAGDIAKALGVSFQKITPILKALVAEGVAVAETAKGKTVYRLA